MGDDYSLAWRMLDAQYWGVPQRRKRIYLVADFAGQRAGKILFESESVSGDPSPRGETREISAGDVGGSPAGSNHMECLTPWDYQSKRIYSINGIAPTLPAMGDGARNNQAVLYPYATSVWSRNENKASGIEYSDNEIHIEVYDARGNSDGKHCPVLTGDHNNRITDYTAIIVCRRTKIGEYIADGSASTMTATDYKSPRDLVVEYHGNHEADCSTVMQAKKRTHSLSDEVSCEQNPAFLGESIHNHARRRYCLRRLTPLECCRLQGFPDGWGVLDYKDALNDEDVTFWQNVRDTCADISGKPHKKYSGETLTKWYNGLHSDSAEYKMWGNGIALPCAVFVLRGIHLALCSVHQQ